MGDNYYNDQYRQGGYPAQARDQYAGQQRQEAYGGQNYYAQPQQGGYDTYRPPTEEGYRGSPVPPNMQVAPYDDRHRRSGSFNSHNRRSRNDYDDYDDRYSDRDPRYLTPGHHSRPGSRGSHKEKDKEHRNSEAKSLGATILGGVAGALIGRKAGNKDILPTVLGGVAGAWGGHKLEEEYVDRRSKSRHRSKSRGRHEEAMAYEGRGRRGSDQSEGGKSFKEKVKERLRSLSRKRGGDDERSRSRRRDDSDDSDDDRRRRRHSSRGRDDYERESRYDRERY